MSFLIITIVNIVLKQKLTKRSIFKSVTNHTTTTRQCTFSVRTLSIMNVIASEDLQEICQE